MVPASFVDTSYSPRKDLYDAVLNTLFPIFIAFLLNISGKPIYIKNDKLLLLLRFLDGGSYNIVTWIIPLMISFFYDDLVIKIFSFVNMLLHVICASITVIIRRNEVTKNDIKTKESFFDSMRYPYNIIPLFWILWILGIFKMLWTAYTNSTIRDGFDSISWIFLALFGLLLIILIIDAVKCKICNTIRITFFYVPNILQTIFIILNWPVNFYFVKACVFILILSLTRNVSYFIEDKIPGDLLATSTTVTQCNIKGLANNNDFVVIFETTKKEVSKSVPEQSDHEMGISNDNLETSHDGMKKRMDDMERSMNNLINELKNNKLINGNL